VPLPHGSEETPGPTSFARATPGEQRCEGKGKVLPRDAGAGSRAAWEEGHGAASEALNHCKRKAFSLG